MTTTNRQSAFYKLKPHYQRLIRRYSAWNAALALGSICLLNVGNAFLLNIDSQAPVKNQPNGPLWMVIFVATIVTGVPFGMQVGRYLFARHFATKDGWPPELRKNVQLGRDYPAAWKA